MARRDTGWTHNAGVASGKDEWFFKDQSLLRPVARPPFYAVEVRPAIVALTAFGLRINPDAHVLDEAERPIPGLYAAGEGTGGVLGDRYLGGGNSVANAVVFGRIAGTNAAREVLGR